MDERARLALQEQLTQLEQQFGERLQADLAELATLARDLQQTRATGSRRQLMLSVRERLHRLAGAAGTFGFASLGDNARQLEQRADRWLDSAKPGSRAADAFAAALLQLASETPGQEREGAAALPVHHEEPAPGCRIYLMKRDPIAATSMAVTLRNFGYMVSQWHDFAALEQALANELPDALIVGIEHEGEFDALAALQQSLEQPLPLLVIHDRNDFTSQLAAVRIANGSQVRGGFLIQAGLPRNWLARFQIVEYLRAFLFGRLGWSPLNAVLIISGAFGLFDRERVMAVGGYRTDTVGEDMELVVRLHRYHREKRIPYRIRYLPDPICWTECPEDLGTLGRQRSRWQRGLAESLGRHARLAFSLRGGTPGWLAWPFMALFEWIGPLIELVGYGFMLAGFAFGAVSYAALAAFLLVAIGMGILLSVNGLLLETMSFRVYSRRRDMLQLFLMAVLENFGYRQLNTLWRCRGLWQWFSRRKHQWGVMRRSGQWGQS
ncbi:glycosyltransferase family 2 protein [Stutzerimonas stutzeri]|uniref:glycosyltransferase family 2 protein n=1 Tax=Stutzerimonas stutzeri TaxID=316 RepID=UPI00300EF971